MRQPRRDKQKMYYSLAGQSTVEYERDDNGDIVYVEVDGQMIPVPTGEMKAHFTEPIEFKASISSQLNEMHIKSYGVDASSIYSELCCTKGYLPIKVGTLIWRESPIEWEDEINRIPLGSSADYTVKGIMTEGLTEDFFLLQRNVNEQENKD